MCDFGRPELLPGTDAADHHGALGRLAVRDAYTHTRIAYEQTNTRAHITPLPPHTRTLRMRVALARALFVKPDLLLLVCVCVCVAPIQT